MTTNGSDPTEHAYEVLALEYGSMTRNKSGNYHLFKQYGEPDAPEKMSYFFWLIRREGLVVLVDCGMNLDRARDRGYVLTGVDPERMLQRVGVSAADVDHVIISHMHLDHVGNLDLFTNAEFTIAEAEYDFWTGPFADRAFFACASQPDEVATLQQLAEAGRVRRVEGETEILPGITVTPFRGHTPGQIITHVTTESGRVVLASDAAHFYEEMYKDRPFWLFNDLEGMYRCYAYLRDLATCPGVSIVPGHDPLVMDNYHRLTDGCVDLARRLQDDPLG